MSADRADQHGVNSFRAGRAGERLDEMDFSPNFREYLASFDLIEVLEVAGVEPRLIGAAIAGALLGDESMQSALAQHFSGNPHYSWSLPELSQHSAARLLARVELRTPQSDPILALQAVRGESDGLMGTCLDVLSPHNPALAANACAVITACGSLPAVSVALARLGELQPGLASERAAAMVRDAERNALSAIVGLDYLKSRDPRLAREAARGLSSSGIGPAELRASAAEAENKGGSLDDGKRARTGGEGFNRLLMKCFDNPGTQSSLDSLRKIGQLEGDGATFSLALAATSEDPRLVGTAAPLLRSRDATLYNMLLRSRWLAQDERAPERRAQR